MINEKPQVIQEYESGKAIPNQQIITKLERALGVKLRGKKWKTMPLVNTLKKICLHYYCILWSPKTWATFEFCCSGVHEFLCLGLLLQKGVEWIWWKMTDWVWEIILVIYRLGETLNTKVWHSDLLCKFALVYWWFLLLYESILDEFGWENWGSSRNKMAWAYLETVF